MTKIDNITDLVEFVASIPWSIKDRSLAKDFAKLPKGVARAFSRIVADEALSRKDCLKTKGQTTRFVPSSEFTDEVTRIAGWLAENGRMPADAVNGTAYGLLLRESDGHTVMTMPGGFRWKWIRKLDDIERNDEAIGYDMGLDAHYGLRTDQQDELPEYAAYLSLVDGDGSPVGALWLSECHVQGSHRLEASVGPRKFKAMCDAAYGYVVPRLVMEYEPTAEMSPGEHFNNYGAVVHVNEKGFLHREDGPALIGPDEEEEGNDAYFLDGKEVKEADLARYPRRVRRDPDAYQGDGEDDDSRERPGLY